MNHETDRIEQQLRGFDLTARVVELQLNHAAYQAALSVTARAVQPSLLDFLR